MARYVVLAGGRHGETRLFFRSDLFDELSELIAEVLTARVMLCVYYRSTGTWRLLRLSLVYGVCVMFVVGLFWILKIDGWGSLRLFM